MNGKSNRTYFEECKDSLVTAVSLVVIVLQSLIIILGFVNRWDWIAYECAAMLTIPSIIILYYGIKAVINANRLMKEELDNGEN